MRRISCLLLLAAVHAGCSVYDESLLEEAGQDTIGGGGGTLGSGAATNTGGIVATGSTSNVGGTTGGTGGATGGSGSVPATGGGSGGTTAGSGGETGGTGGTAEVHVYTMIDEVSGSTGAISLPNGDYWFTTAATNCTIVPASEPTGTDLPEERDGNFLGMHFTGPACTGDWGAQSGLGLVSGQKQYDASAFDGIAFWAKQGAAGTENLLSVEISNAASHPNGGLCDDPGKTGALDTPTTTDDCYLSYSKTISLSAEWKLYEIPFPDFKQSGTGYKGSYPLDQATLYQINFAWRKPDQAFDVWIDDVQFYAVQD